MGTDASCGARGTHGSASGSGHHFALVSIPESNQKPRYEDLDVLRDLNSLPKVDQPELSVGSDHQVTLWAVAHGRCLDAGSQRYIRLPLEPHPSHHHPPTIHDNRRARAL
eukprot:7082290-Prymnesium_polylepis.1